MNTPNATIDAVYTWVDDQQPGYADLLRQYARSGHDTNPNRTRDNLGTLKYSLRSLEKHIPWIRRIYLLTSRPQKPEWLDTTNERITLVHHDEIIDSRYLPTFNSFCIVSHLHEIHGLSENFLYIEDDMLFGGPTVLQDFMTETDNKLLVYPRAGKTTPPEKMEDEQDSPWNLSMAYTNHLLNESYGYKRRCSINRIPLLIRKTAWQEMLNKWPDAITHTRSCRFRAKHNIAPEYLYPYFMLYTGRARMTSIRDTYKKALYLGLENSRWLTAAGLCLIKYLKPSMYCLNDNFGDRPNARVVKITSDFLEEYYPEKSSFEF